MKTYLGDAVYADFDGNGIELTTENGISVSNRIYLEPEVLEALIKFAEKQNFFDKQKNYITTEWPK